MAQIDQALILAAGRGMRLGPRGREMPKGFLQIGGLALIERAIGKLRQAGFTQITIVTGHLAQHYEDLAGRLGEGIRLIHNPDYATRGSGHSLAVGLSAVQGDFLLLESDLIWELAAVVTLLKHAKSSVMLTSGPTAAGDEVWVWAEDETADRPTLGTLSKRRETRPSTPFGEMVGITRISAELSDELRSRIAIASIADPMIDYESCLVAASRIVPTDLLRLETLAWAEIDDETMYARVRDMVWPRIRARDAALSNSSEGK